MWIAQMLYRCLPRRFDRQSGSPRNTRGAVHRSGLFIGLQAERVNAFVGIVITVGREQQQPGTVVKPSSEAHPLVIGERGVRPEPAASHRRDGTVLQRLQTGHIRRTREIDLAYAATETRYHVPGKFPFKHQQRSVRKHAEIGHSAHLNSSERSAVQSSDRICPLPRKPPR